MGSSENRRNRVEPIVDRKLLIYKGNDSPTLSRFIPVRPTKQAWGARGREFESRHPDHRNQRVSSHKELTRFSLESARGKPRGKPRGGSPGIVWDQQVWSRCDDAAGTHSAATRQKHRSVWQGGRPAPEAWSLDGARGCRRRVLSVRWARLTEDDRPTCYESLGTAHPIQGVAADQAADGCVTLTPNRIVRE